MAPDRGSGLCVPCRQANASTHLVFGSCSSTDATRCESGEWDCAGSFYCNNATGQCTSCPQAGCRRCEDGAQPGECYECLPGYWDTSQPINEQRYRASPLTDHTERMASFTKVPTECKPCNNANCLKCQSSLGAACERCADGYFLDRSTKLCRAVGDCSCWRVCLWKMHASNAALVCHS